MLCTFTIISIVLQTPMRLHFHAKWALFRAQLSAEMSSITTQEYTFISVWGICILLPACSHTHTCLHTRSFLWFTGTHHRRNGFYTVQNCMCYCSTPTLHLNLALTGEGFLLSPQKTHSVWFISIFNYGDHDDVLINNLLLVIPLIPMSLYKCLSS